jgi:hypothetical protein
VYLIRLLLDDSESDLFITHVHYQFFNERILVQKNDQFFLFGVAYARDEVVGDKVSQARL